ncbi:MAG: DUF1206 domain-containing protein [Planctomycetaceae bacterium]|nr:DUF1206 domain-containing protein [Planctomycetaceae bacterium]
MNATATTNPSILNPEHRRWIELLARCGYAAKGFVYAIIGGLALQVALSEGGQTSGPQGALSTIASQPFGQFLLIAVGIGLFGYSLWRIVQAAVDPENKGTDAQGIATRIGYACSGVVYTLLGIEAIRMVLSGAGGGSGSSSAEHWTGKLMSQPFGPSLVAILGIAIIGTGLYQFYRAYSAKFQEMLLSGQMSTTELKWSERVGRAGFSARGVVYLIMGGFLLVAAFRSNPDEAMGIGQSLSYLSKQSYGPWLLGLVAVGLSAYGIFAAAILSRYRRILANQHAQ